MHAIQIIIWISHRYDVDHHIEELHDKFEIVFPKRSWSYAVQVIDFFIVLWTHR